MVVAGSVSFLMMEKKKEREEKREKGKEFRAWVLYIAEGYVSLALTTLPNKRGTSLVRPVTSCSSDSEASPWWRSPQFSPMG